VTRKAIRYYSQHYVDMLDLDHNRLVTKPAEEVLGADFHSLRWVASTDDGDTIRPPLTIGAHLASNQLVLTFDLLLQRSNFVPVMKEVLTRLAAQYERPVDVEFAVSLTPGANMPSQNLLTFHLLQCRPQNRGISRNTAIRPVPTTVPKADQLFFCTHMVPQGAVEQVTHVILVDPAAYQALETPRDYTEVARLIGHLNKALEGQSFITIGPGRWGSNDYLQGVPVTYADIYNTSALIELAIQQHGYSSEPSYGTHFFQDLVETQIYPLAVHPEDPDDFFNWDFLNGAANQMEKIYPHQPSSASRCIKVIHIPAERPGYRLELVMDGIKGLGYLTNAAVVEDPHPALPQGGGG
jgi:hypothetical protein